VLQDTYPRSQRVAAEVAKVGIRLRLLRLARRVSRSKSLADAEDLVGDALAAACDPGHKPWDPPPPFLTHMTYVIRDMSIEHKRRGHGRFEIVDSPVAADEDAADPAPLPDEEIAQRDDFVRLRELGVELRARVSHLPHAGQVFDLACEGLDDSAEVAAKLECRVEDVYQAHRTLKRYASDIADRASRLSP
jgi:DNA-directed RNA polymerase specialized sigma24 family protein